MLTWTIPCVVALSFIVIFHVARRYFDNGRSGKPSSCPLPPGPPGIPFVGNVIGINTNAPWLTYAEWANKYGDLVYTRLFGNHIIIINSEKVARDLLENRSRNYSDRPYMATIALCGLDFSSALMRYGDRWRLHRRFFHQTFRSDASMRFLPLQHRKACSFLRRLFDNPDGLAEHVFEYTTTIILNSVYDYDATSRQDELVAVIAKVIDIVVPTLRPETAIIIGMFPALLKLPSWLPGMLFKRKMAIAKEYSQQYIEKPFAYGLHRMTKGTASPSMIYDALYNVEERGGSASETWMEALKDAAATGFLAAAETSNMVLMTFFLMMVVSPEVQARAQAQIDALVGSDRLPDIKDRPSLPYVDAVLRETLRYSPVVPLSLPHAAVDDDVYAGFHIPKGAILVANLWSMAHDAVKYPNPHEFNPERFLDDNGSLKPYTTEHLTYGFGRRICVGRYFADTSLWSVIAKFLAVFKILKPVDENGVEIRVEPKFTGGVAVHPLPFGFRILPRKPDMNVETLEELIAASTT